MFPLTRKRPHLVSYTIQCRPKRDTVLTNRPFLMFLSVPSSMPAVNHNRHDYALRVWISSFANGHSGRCICPTQSDSFSVKQRKTLVSAPGSRIFRATGGFPRWLHWIFHVKNTFLKRFLIEYPVEYRKFRGQSVMFSVGYGHQIPHQITGSRTTADSWKIVPVASRSLCWCVTR